MNGKSISNLSNMLDKRSDTLPHTIAETVLDNTNLFLCKNNLYLYKDKVYVKQTKESMLCELQSLLPNELLGKCSLKSQKEAIQLVYARSRVIEKLPRYENLLNLQNGIYCIDDGSLRDHSPRYLFTYCLNVSYTKNYDIPLFRDFITQTFKKTAMQQHVQEVCGYLISDMPPLKEFLLFYGQSNTAKSALAAIIRYVVGDENVNSVNIQNLSHEYYLANMCEKRLNICSDIGSTVINDLSVIKQLTSPDDTIQVRHIRSETHLASEKPKLIFASNHYPALVSDVEDLDAFFNRVHIIPFKHIVPKEAQVEGLAKKIFDAESSGIFNWMMEGYRRFLSNGKKFTPAKAVNKAQEKYRSLYMIPKDFINDCVEFSPNKKVFTKELEQHLKWYCEDINDCAYTYTHLQQVRKILQKNGISNKKVRKKDKVCQGFYGIKLVKLDEPVSFFSFD